jgi:glycosyltransferase involved in cell wall biosynthesis
VRAKAYRLTYWTGVWEPAREAISKEVAWLRTALAPGSLVVSFTHQRTALDIAGRVCRINAHHWRLFRAVAFGAERLGHVNHVFGGLGTTEHFLRPLGRRPILFTVVIAGQPSSREIYRKVSHFVAESRELRSALIDAGVEPDRIDVIYPAIDLQKYSLTPPPAGPFTLLFASSPPDAGEIEGRGVRLLVELARVRPDVQIRVLWRRWGQIGEAMRQIGAWQPPENFQLDVRDASDMAAMYASVHATVCLFAPGTGKSAPNSVVEGLACGRPALLSEGCGIADVVAEWDAGRVADRQVQTLSFALSDLQRNYERARRQARALAEREFDRVTTLSRYAAIYERLASTRVALMS